MFCFKDLSVTKLILCQLVVTLQADDLTIGTETVHHTHKSTFCLSYTSTLSLLLPYWNWRIGWHHKTNDCFLPFSFFNFIKLQNIFSCYLIWRLMRSYHAIINLFRLTMDIPRTPTPPQFKKKGNTDGRRLFFRNNLTRSGCARGTLLYVSFNCWRYFLSQKNSFTSKLKLFCCYFSEIIEKVKFPPPLIRPSVSKGAAPPEAINIMRQCWAEQAEMRPDFNSVHDLFKKLNHGKKVNIVDTMFQMLEKYSNNLEELIRERTEQLDFEKKKTEQLLNRMLPR